MFNQQNYQAVCELAKDLKPVPDASKLTACCLRSRPGFSRTSEVGQLDACGVPSHQYSVNETGSGKSTFEEIRYECPRTWMSLILGN